jgi:integrase
MPTPRIKVSKRQRRSFGRLIEKNGKRRAKVYRYLEASYPTPIEAFNTWPNLPQRIYATFSLERETDADTWLTTEKKLIDNGDWTPPAMRKNRERRDRVPFKEYAESYVEHRHRRDGNPIQETTKDKYREYLRLYLPPFFGDRPMDGISADDVQDWFDRFPVRKGGHGESARKHVYDLLSAIFAEACSKPINDIGDTLLRVNPCRIAVRTPRQRKESLVAEPGELKKAYEAMPSWLRLIVYLCGVMGLREGEALGLQRKDFDLKSNRPTLSVRRNVKEVIRDHHRVSIVGVTKTASSVRDIDIPPFMIDLIHLHLETYVGESQADYVFTAPRSGGLVKAQTVRNAWYRALKSIPRLTGMRFYDLRHTALSKAVEAGASLGTVKSIAGHAVDTTAFHYQHESETNRISTLENINANFVENGKNPETSMDTTLAQSDDTDLDLHTVLATVKALPAKKRNEVLKLLPAEVLAGIVTQLSDDIGKSL